jgi:hypothetical protein
MVRKRLTSWIEVAALVLLATACQREGADRSEDGEASAEADDPAGGMRGMQGMGEMGGMTEMNGMQMDSAMMGHMQRMETMHGDSLMQMMPQHRRMLEDMMARMDAEMRALSVEPDSGWTALADSVRNDLARIGGDVAVGHGEFQV